MHCLLTFLNDYLLKQFVGNMLLGTSHDRLRQQIYRGTRIYPLAQISIHQAVSEGVNNKAAHLLSGPQ